MSCTHTISSDALFCPYCGEKQARQLCKCLQINSDNARFCTRCGSQLLKAETEAVADSKRARKKEALSRYNIDEILDIARNDPNAVSVVKNVRISQEDINAIFKRKRDDDSK